MREEISRLEKFICEISRDLLMVLQKIYSHNRELIKENEELKKKLSIYTKLNEQSKTDLNS